MNPGLCIADTVKPALSGQSSIDKTNVLNTNGSLMKVESMAEYCYRGRGRGGGKHFSKTFSIFYMLNSKKNRVFYPYFSIDTCPMRIRLLQIIRGLNLLSFSLKKHHFL